MFLAEGVATVTTVVVATTDVGSAWLQWLSPQGIMALLSVLALCASILGKKDLAARLNEARDAADGKQDQIQAGVSTLRAVIQGVEAAKKNMQPEAKAALLSAIQSATKAAGMETTLSPLVDAVTKGGASAPVLEKVLADVTDKLQAAQPTSTNGSGTAEPKLA